VAIADLDGEKAQATAAASACGSSLNRHKGQEFSFPKVGIPFLPHTRSVRYFQKETPSLQQAFFKLVKVWGDSVLKKYNKFFPIPFFI
jgi:hypothetical protein